MRFDPGLRSGRAYNRRANRRRHGSECPGMWHARVLQRTCLVRAGAGAMASPAPFVPVLDRIRIDRTHIVGPIDPVNPVYKYKVEQIHAVDGIADGDSNQPRSALATCCGVIRTAQKPIVGIPLVRICAEGGLTRFPTATTQLARISGSKD